jgi:hypothetical protein
MWVTLRNVQMQRVCLCCSLQRAVSTVPQNSMVLIGDDELLRRTLPI